MNSPTFRVCLAAVFLAAFSSLASTTNSSPEEPIMPLHPPRPELPPSFAEQYGLWVGIGAAILLVAVAVVAWYATRPKKPPILAPAALQARQELEPLRLEPESGALLSRVSQVLRRYVATAFSLPLGELTTTEFSRAIAAREQIGKDLSRAVTEFLRECDQRKFASAPPATPFGAVQRADELIGQAEAQRERLRQAAAPKPSAAAEANRA